MTPDLRTTLSHVDLSLSLENVSQKMLRKDGCGKTLLRQAVNNLRRMRPRSRSSGLRQDPSGPEVEVEGGTGPAKRPLKTKRLLVDRDLPPNPLLHRLAIQHRTCTGTGTDTGIVCSMLRQYASAERFGRTPQDCRDPVLSSM
jgi:hypothetical protein